MQLKPAFNLIDAQPVQLSLRLSEHPELVYGMRVLAPVQNRGAFLPRIPEEGLYRHFRMAEHSPLANPSHFRAPLAAHRTDGGSADRGVGDYATKEEDDSGEDG